MCKRTKTAAIVTNGLQPPAPPRSPEQRLAPWPTKSGRNFRASGRRTGACRNACRPPWTPVTDCRTGCGVCRTRRHRPVADLLRQQAPGRRVSEPPSAAVPSTALLWARAVGKSPPSDNGPSDATPPSQEHLRRPSGPPTSGGHRCHRNIVLLSLHSQLSVSNDSRLSFRFLLTFFLPLPFLFSILSPDLFAPTLKSLPLLVFFFSHTGTCSFGEGVM